MADEMEYLQPSFDASSVTMPRLRNILMTHGVQYPPSAKKAELVNIFNQELKPKSRKLLAARDRVRRTSAGITNMPSSQEGTVDGDDDDRSSMLPPPVPDTPRPRKSRRARRLSSEDAVSEPIPKGPPPTGKRSSNKHSRQSDTETEQEVLRPTVRKVRKSDSNSKVKLEEPEDFPVRPAVPGSAFSDDNPFQSGSSPLSGEASRRKFASTSSERKKSHSSRRRTERISDAGSKREQTDGAVVPTSRTFEMPVSSLKKPQIKVEPTDEVEAGEEFVPEEQLELMRQRAASGQKDYLPPRRRQLGRKESKVPRSLPWMVLMALLGGYTTWFRQEKLAVGYCDIGRSSDAISSVQIPDWASFLLPSCEQCPQHAICYEGLETRCERDFILQPHPLSLGGLVPVPPTCEPDGEKARKVKAVADRAVDELRERNALVECGNLKDSEGKLASRELGEQELKQVVAGKRRRSMTDAEFEDLWKGAIDEMIGLEEVLQSSDGTHLSSTSLAHLPFACAIKRSARLTLARHRGAFSLVTFLFLLASYVRSRIIQNRADAARVPYLVATTLDRLATQATLYSRGDAHESWISVGQLRDDVLRDEFSAQRREAMWTRVRDVVERNANVRASSRELRGGDVSRVWEWIGSLGLIDDPGFSGRKSGGKRVSWGGEIEDKETTGKISPADGGAEVEHGKDIRESRKWDEGRPIY